MRQPDYSAPDAPAPTRPHGVVRVIERFGNWAARDRLAGELPDGDLLEQLVVDSPINRARDAQRIVNPGREPLTADVAHRLGLREGATHGDALNVLVAEAELCGWLHAGARHGTQPDGVAMLKGRRVMLPATAAQAAGLPIGALVADAYDLIQRRTADPAGPRNATPYSGGAAEMNVTDHNERKDSR